RPLDDARVPSGTCSADRVVRAGDTEVQRDFPGRIVGDRARVVVMRPTTRVVIEPLDDVDLVFGLNIAVFGHADVDTHARFVRVFPLDAGVGDRLVGGVDADAASPGTPPDILLWLVLRRGEVADSGQGF